VVLLFCVLAALCFPANAFALVILLLFGSAPLITRRFYFCFLIYIFTDIFLTCSLPLIAPSNAFSLAPSLIFLYSFLPSLCLFLFLFVLPCIYRFSPWVWICHHFLIFNLNICILLYLFYSSCGSLPHYLALLISPALLAARLAPHCFTSPKLKDCCRVPKVLRLRNFISFTSNY